MNTNHRFVTHTLAESVENHAGMETLGKKRPHGFTEAHIKSASERLGAELHTLDRDDQCASVLVVRGGVDALLGGAGGADRLLLESLAQRFDTTFLNTRRDMVQTKHGRHNNCYADVAQEPDIAAGKGTVVSFDTAPEMAKIRAALPGMLGPEATNLFAETNLYTDVRSAKVGIGFHGDTERSIVVGLRLGAASLPLRFQWYHRSQPVGEEVAIPLYHGDLYAMSFKATGHDWMKSSKLTLRHGTGRKAKRKPKKKSEHGKPVAECATACIAKKRKVD